MTKLLLLLIAASAAYSQTLPVPDAPVAKDFAGAKELPNPGTTYKLVFDIAKAAEKDDQVNPAFTSIGRLINTLAKYGVPPDHRRIAVVFHQKGTPIVLNNEAFRARYGHDNPNIPIIRELSKAGVDFRVCGQGVMAEKIDPKTIQPEIQLDFQKLI
ncbi:MAG: DsrE family protein [Acidobacteriota bacterium]|nr:DsrE family protein [Acidobacteriota bacterium]